MNVGGVHSLPSHVLGLSARWDFGRLFLGLGMNSPQLDVDVPFSFFFWF